MTLEKRSFSLRNFRFFKFFIFFIKQVPVPPIAPVPPPVILHAHTPFGIQESRFSVRRVRTGECGEIVRIRCECYTNPLL